MAAPTKLAHVVFRTGQLTALRDWYCTVLEAHVVHENDFLAFDGGPREAGAMIRDAGLEITLFQPFRDFEGMPGERRAKAFDRAERKFDLMQELGAELMLICSNTAADSLGGGAVPIDASMRRAHERPRD